MTRSGVVPSALELLDRHCLRAVDDWKHLGLEADAAAILLARVDSPGAAGEIEAETVRAAFDEGGATWSARSEDAQEAEALFAARRLAYPALERLGPVLTEDVCVPLGAVADDAGDASRRSPLRYDVHIANLAHAGDGNLHPLLITPPGDDAARTRAQAAFEEIHATAIALGGTVTGEHGVGLLKRGGLVAEVDPGGDRDAPRHPRGARPGRHPQPGQGRRRARGPRGHAGGLRCPASRRLTASGCTSPTRILVELPVGRSCWCTAAPHPPPMGAHRGRPPRRRTPGHRVRRAAGRLRRRPARVPRRVGTAE